MQRKQYITAIMILILFTAITACSKESKGSPAIEQPTSPNEQQAAPAETIKKETVSYELQPEEIDLVKQYMKALDKVRLSRSIAKAKPGDILVLALAVKNKIGRENTFLISIEFRNALSSSSSTLPVDKTQIQQWVAKNVYTPQTIKAAETNYLPLIIEIPAEEITKGNYIFDIIVKEKGEKSDHSYDSQKLNIQVD